MTSLLDTIREDKSIVTKDIKYIPMLKVINKEDGSIDFKVIDAIPIEYIKDWCNKDPKYYDLKRDFGKRLIEEWRNV